MGSQFGQCRAAVTQLDLRVGAPSRTFVGKPYVALVNLHCRIKILHIAEKTAEHVQTAVRQMVGARTIRVLQQIDSFADICDTLPAVAAVKNVLSQKHQTLRQIVIVASAPRQVNQPIKPIQPVVVPPGYLTYKAEAVEGLKPLSIIRADLRKVEHLQIHAIGLVKGHLVVHRVGLAQGG